VIPRRTDHHHQQQERTNRTKIAERFHRKTGVRG
jgi:hypothetical protein